jgi:uncharacterized SAM-binding protein YcdF (DUF218 family)
MRNGRRWRIAAAATILLGLLSPLSAPPSSASSSATVADLKARLVYFTKAGRTTDRELALNALGAKSSVEAKLWKAFLTAWDTATTSQKLNYSAPDGLPKSGHTFVVLGGSLNSNGTLKKQTINRLKVAKDALAAYPKSGVLVSGGAPKSGVTEGEAMHDWLVDNGIPEKRITTETKSSSTVGNAKYSIAILAKMPDVSSYTLVSDASHLRRAGVLFDAAVLQTEEKTGRTWDLARIANVAYKDKKIVNPASDATTTTIAAEVASLLGLSGYSAMVGEAPAKAKLTALTVVPPSATTYQVGAELRTAGLKATAVFDSGAGTLDVTDKVSLKGYDATKVGTPKVTASYTAGSVTKTASFTVSVAKASASVGLNLSTTKVKRGKTRVTVKVKVASATGVSASGKVKVYSGKTKLKTITLKKGAASCKLPRFTKSGTKTITVKYSGSETVASAKGSVKLKVKK